MIINQHIQAQEYLNVNSMLYDGTNEYHVNNDKSGFSYIQNTNDFALSVWVKLTDYTADSFQAFCGNNRASAASKGFLFNYDNRSSIGSPKHLQIYVTNGSASSCFIRTATNAITDNNWHHVLVTTNGTTGALYVDNVAQTLATETYSTLPTGDSTYSMNIAASGQAGFGGFLAGNIDELSFWNTKLDASEVSEVYNSACPSDLNDHSLVANLVNWYRMGENDTYATMTDVIGSLDATHVNMDASNLTTTTTC